MQSDKFEYTNEGYKKAKQWLQKVGYWERASTHWFSTDGFSIVQIANDLYKKLKK